jgi:type VI secretion system secreted protein VgrG
MHGPQTALVVGPSGEEIYTDEHGRIKVQFYWDRRSEGNEKSSKWVRVCQPAAGGGYGFCSLPRIGQEVIVEYIDGDPDRPIVTGCVYNGNNKPPYSLPGEKTKSCWKSNSSKGGGGYNEIRMEDSKSSEQIFIHAQKDMDTYIEEKSCTYTGKSYHLKVDENYAEEIKGNMDTIVGKNQNTKIGGSYSLKVTGDEKVKVDGTISRVAGKDMLLKASSGVHVDGQTVYIKGAMKVVIEAMQVSLVGAGGFVDIGPAGVSIQGTMVLINSGGAAGSGVPVGEMAPENPATAEKAKSSCAGEVEKSKGYGHAGQSGTWDPITVHDKKAQTGEPFYTPSEGGTAATPGGEGAGAGGSKDAAGASPELRAAAGAEEVPHPQGKRPQVRAPVAAEVPQPQVRHQEARAGTLQARRRVHPPPAVATNAIIL